MPVPGSTSWSMNCFRVVATFRPWTGVRSLMAGLSVGMGSQEGKKSSTSRRLLPMRDGAVSSCSSGKPARLTHSVV